MRVLPVGEFDGQRFIDAARVEWIFDASVQCWKRKGRIDATPVADGVVTGLLPADMKFLLDKVPPKGGGFAITTRPHHQFRSASNPDGVIFGDVNLTSRTLDIKCVHADGREIGEACFKICFQETDEQPPGFDINFSDDLLSTLCVEVPGGPGPRGRPGPKGEDGKDGTGDGPTGLKGEAGENATVGHRLTGVRIVDTDNVSDVAVTKMELDADSGKLFVTKGPIKVPDNEEATANRLIVSQINRGIRFLGNCFDYELTILPCRPDDDFDTLDPTIAYLPKHFDPQDINLNRYQPVKRRLSDLISDIIAFYQAKLDSIAQQYDTEIEQFIKEKDKEARLILDKLGDRLAECEMITYLDYCIGIGDTCVEEEGEAGPAIELPATDPDCQIFAEAYGSAGSSCQILSTLTVRGDASPVFAFSAPNRFRLGQGSGIGSGGGGIQQYEQICPNGCWTQSGAALAYVPRGGRVAPGWQPIPPPNRPNAPPPVVTSRAVGGDTPGGGGPDQKPGPDDKTVDDLTERLKQGVVTYRRQQFQYSPLTAEFPPGNYAFVYLRGGFKQDRLSRGQSFGSGTEDLIQGPFQEWFVGNEGNGRSTGPFYVLNPTNKDRRQSFDVPISTTAIGLEIGFAPSSTFKNLLPPDYFDTHAFDPKAEVGNNAVELPNRRVDFDGLAADVKQDEALIQWRPFPTIEANHKDLASMQNSYIQGFAQGRSLNFNTTTPGFFFSRVKIAYSAYNFYGTLVMPPVEQQVLRPASLNRAQINIITPTKPPETIFIPGFGTVTGGVEAAAVLNARPIATGEVIMQAIKIVPPATPPPAAVNTTVEEGEVRRGGLI